MEPIPLLRRATIFILSILLLGACSTIPEERRFTDAKGVNAATIKPYGTEKRKSLFDIVPSVKITTVNGKSVPTNWNQMPPELIKIDPGVTILVAKVELLLYPMLYSYTIPMEAELKPETSYEIRVRRTSRTRKGSQEHGMETWLVQMPSGMKASPSFYSKGLQ